MFPTEEEHLGVDSNSGAAQSDTTLNALARKALRHFFARAKRERPFCKCSFEQPSKAPFSMVVEGFNIFTLVKLRMTSMTGFLGLTDHILHLDDVVCLKKTVRESSEVRLSRDILSAR